MWVVLVGNATFYPGSWYVESVKPRGAVEAETMHCTIWASSPRTHAVWSDKPFMTFSAAVHCFSVYIHVFTHADDTAGRYSCIVLLERCAVGGYRAFAAPGPVRYAVRLCKPLVTGSTTVERFNLSVHVPADTSESAGRDAGIVLLKREVLCKYGTFEAPHKSARFCKPFMTFRAPMKCLNS